MLMKYEKKLPFFYVAVKCATTGGTEQIPAIEWTVMINPPELSKIIKLKMMHILQAQVCGCISAHPGLPHQKMKRETSDASKSQLNQASWNSKVLKFGWENQLNVHIYLSIFFCDFPLIARSRKSQVTVSLMGCAPHSQSLSPLYWRMWELGLLAFE